MENVLSISDLTNRTQGIIHARVFKVWAATDPKNGNAWAMNFVLLDNQGGAIQGVVPISFYRRMEGNFAEGKACEIGRFTLEHVKAGYRTVEHKFSLSFSGQTYVTSLPSNLHDIPLCYFVFKSLEDVGTTITDETQPIGRVSDFTYVEEIVAKGEPTRRQAIYITNERGHTLDIVLWGNTIDQLDIDGVYEKSGNEHIILACSSLLVKKYQGKYGLKAYGGTMFYTDRGLKEINEYFKSINSDEAVLKTNRRHASCNDGTSSSAMLRKVDHREISLAKLSSLKLDNRSTAHYICVVEVLSINNRYDWYYEGCLKCNTRLRDFWCNGCKTRIHDNALCYKLNLQVKDDTAEAEFSAIGNTAENMVGEKASVILEESNRNANELPSVLNKLIGKKYKFTVSGKVQAIYKYHRVYTILQSELVAENQPVQLHAITNECDAELAKNTNQLPEIDHDGKQKEIGSSNIVHLKAVKQENITAQKEISSPTNVKPMMPVAVDKRHFSNDAGDGSDLPNKHKKRLHLDGQPVCNKKVRRYFSIRDQWKIVLQWKKECIEVFF